MSSLQVDSLLFDFEPTVAAQKYDGWHHYHAVWNREGGQKAMDVVAVDSGKETPVTWLIEAKDFRIVTNPPKPSNIGGLAQQVAAKANDTLAGLADAARIGAVDGEREHAALALASPTRRIVLHLEPHVGPRSALFPAGFSAIVLQQLRQLVKAIDPHPLVLNIARTPTAGVPWRVS